MKNNVTYGFVLIYFFLGMNLLFAQSDYEIVQNFKEKSRQIEQAIKDADSLNALNEIAKSIELLKDNFMTHKELLDMSLYPDNFNLAIEKLENSLSLRENDFTKIDILSTEVTGLKEQVDTFNQRNNELISQFELLESQTREDRVRVIQLEKVVAQLKTSLKKRDQVVMNMIDSLLPSSYRAIEELSLREKREIYAQAEKSNVLFHIKRAVGDNIRFLEATKLYPKDLGEIKDQQKIFTRIWKSVGPTMVELYSEKEKGTNELKEIDEAFTIWHEKVDHEAWVSINDKFAEKEIILKRFSNGNEFTSAITSFINYELKNVNEKGDRESIIAYKNFAEKVWYREVDPDWIPFLLDYDMLASEQKDTIEVMLASWRDTVYPGGFNWLLVVVGVIVIAVFTVLLTRRSPKRTAANTTTTEKTG